MLLLCCITLFVSEPSITFSVSHDCMTAVTVTCDVMLTLTLSLKVRNKWKRKENKYENKYENENKPSPMFIILIVCYLG